jgi:predicted hydrocarbon binding protein
MSKEKNEILDKLEYNPEQGILEFNGVRYLVIRPETVMGFFKAVTENLGERTGELAFEGGYQGGSASTSAYKTKFNLSNREILEYMCNMGTQLGWGKFQIEYDSDERLEISVKNSPYALKEALTEDSENGTCHFIRGVLAGLGKTVLGTEVLATEPECEARGDPHCTFVIERAGERK